LQAEAEVLKYKWPELHEPPEICHQGETEASNSVRRSPQNRTLRLYNPPVARGWESKSVESQQEDARSTEEPRPHLSAEQREIESRKEGLKLSRSRILEQLHATQNPLYRKILEQSLAALDEQITRLG
jgi:hypothetical protein